MMVGSDPVSGINIRPTLTSFRNHKFITWRGFRWTHDIDDDDDDGKMTENSIAPETFKSYAFQASQNEDDLFSNESHGEMRWTNSWWPRKLHQLNVQNTPASFPSAIGFSFSFVSYARTFI
jgi:hypothetical protein